MEAGGGKESLLAAIATRLDNDRAAACCDACLALHFHVSLEEAHQAAMEVALRPRYIRKTRRCFGCRRTLELTCLM